MVGNRKDRELDIVLLSAKDGSVVRNLTSGFDKDKGFEYISIQSERSRNAVPWMSWSPRGDRLAYFVRTEKDKTSFFKTSCRERSSSRIADEVPRRARVARIAPDGRTIVFAGLRMRWATSSRSTGRRQVNNLTHDELFDYAPTYSPDGTYLIYAARVSGNQKLFRTDRDPSRRPKSRSAPTTTRRAVLRRPHHCVLLDGHRSDRPSNRKSRATATSTTSGRST